jgi:signal transduction histidine kinase
MTATGEGWPAEPQQRIARLVHDLRTPLTIVQGFAELLERGGDELDDARRTEFLGRIVHAAHDMKQILDGERDDRLGD